MLSSDDIIFQFPQLVSSSQILLAICRGQKNNGVSIQQPN